MLKRCAVLCCAIYSLSLQAQNLPPFPEFTPGRGFYQEPFDLTIAKSGANVEIRYTLDGSNPLHAASAFKTTAPCVLHVDPSNITGRFIAPAVVVRAVALQNNRAITGVATHTFIFPEKLTALSPDGLRPGNGWPMPNSADWSRQMIDYGLDAQVYLDPRYQSLLIASFLSVPSYSLVTDLKNLFAADSGIYMNAMQHGDEWERPVSVEFLLPDGREGFQIDAGLRIRGGWSRHNDNPKHAFRLLFRDQYGPAPLEYPLFEDEGVAEFDNIDLRSSQNYSWAYQGDSRHTFLRDLFSRDTQRDMGRPYTRSRFCHLYLNGVYWGLFQTQERSEASYAESYWGGKTGDYDVIKVDTGENFDLYENEATDGNLNNYRELHQKIANNVKTDALYYQLQGLNPDGTPNGSFKRYLDVDNLIDYMLCTFYVGDFDGPISSFRGNQVPNNYYAIDSHVKPNGFLFFRHDAEHSLMPNSNAGLDRTGPYPAGAEFRHFNPQWLHQKLVYHPHYLLRFSDHAYRHFYNNGCLTPDQVRERLLSRKAEIQSAIIAESARWGDAKSSRPFTREDWEKEINNILNNFVAKRTGVVLAQLLAKKWYSSVTPPVISVTGDDKANERLFTLAGSAGRIYYTLDGRDPYLPTSEPWPAYINPKEHPSGVFEYQSAVAVRQNCLVRARVFSGTEWSPLLEKEILVRESNRSLRLSEMHYNPQGENGSDYEFLELTNAGDAAFDLSGARFSTGITFTFPPGTELASGAFLVLASNSSAFQQRYGFAPFDQYTGKLDNSGEKLALLAANGDTLMYLRYNDKYPWPNLADGWGRSLVAQDVHSLLQERDPEYWRSSTVINGTPGKGDFTVSVDKVGKLPDQFTLMQNYPNPFNQTTAIRYDLQQPGYVTLRIYNYLGQEVALLLVAERMPGRYSLVWHGHDHQGRSLPSGLYFYRLQVDDFSITKKMALVK